jgi:hypothetical protein
MEPFRNRSKLENAIILAPEGSQAKLFAKPRRPQVEADKSLPHLQRPLSQLPEGHIFLTIADLFTGIAQWDLRVNKALSLPVAQ